jgi:hypothetical protein
MGVVAVRTSPSATDSDLWPHPSYEVRVRGTIYLWGSAGITKNIKFDKPILLHVRNDPFGEAITFGTQVAAGTHTTIGTLQAGECVSIPVQDISGVFATCALESNVSCLIRD